MNFIFDGKNSDLTVRRVANMLAYNLDCSKDTIIFADQKLQVYDLAMHPELQNLPADKVKITFYGGPPGYYDVYEGTLLTLLADRIIWEVVHDGQSVIDNLIKLLGRNFSVNPKIQMISNEI